MVPTNGSDEWFQSIKRLGLRVERKQASNVTAPSFISVPARKESAGQEQ
ncbi:MAG: hypothetical protein JXA30_12690 [Deltaproteobacteria bacterium]|nr:hypothetical protein [Deltaproteobacteria bacterium]